MMDLGEFRVILTNSGTDIWSLIEAAIEVASIDYSEELRSRRDGIVAKLHRNPCPSCNHNNNNHNHNHNSNNNNTVNVADKRRRETGKVVVTHSPSTPVSIDGDEEHEEQEKEQEARRRFVNGGDYHDDDDDDNVEVDVDGDDEQRRILSIKEQIEDPYQSEDALLDLLQSLADMDITFKALKETDIGRHVNRLRKHPSNDVKRLVKLLVRFAMVEESRRNEMLFGAEESNNMMCSRRR